ncbi:ATP-binding cassette domain-containing protein [Amnibacterium flavum]|uniref:ABC transporter ATP-binding protein n=1 Tax=Amnibacterium flavum TaxID=2173173 RepID=A0A2V1HSI7_9MICO|nr:ATP-binding cassette domain-containing protein [Amnibacterium flavum]PVZ95565.1 ABC transporter ATP-binding protein [Amnibacterium flavum]
MASETHDRPDTTEGPVLEVTGLRKVFEGRHGAQTVAVAGADFTLSAGECLAVVGESGSGKSTLARSVLRLIEPTAGSVVYRGTDLVGLDKRALRRTRRHLQMIFQDPYASLHPRQTVYRLISEPWRVHRDLMPDRPRDRVAELLDQVGMPASAIDAHPAQLSGGQRQRVSIARALGLKPDVLVLDEPVSALDVSIQAQVITLLMELQQELGLSYLFISHDLALVRLVATRVAVMYRGEFVEFGPTSEIFERPQAEYTRALLSASPALAEFGSGA